MQTVCYARYASAMIVTISLRAAETDVMNLNFFSQPPIPSEGSENANTKGRGQAGGKFSRTRYLRRFRERSDGSSPVHYVTGITTKFQVPELMWNSSRMCTVVVLMGQ